MIQRTLLKFTIPVKELKGLGFTFHKMFASNYKAYTIDIIEGDETYSIWVYVKGRDVEFGGFFSQTSLVMDTIKSEIEKNNVYNDYEFLKEFNPNFKPSDVSYNVHFYLNRLTSKITSYDEYEHNKFLIYERFRQIDKSEYTTDIRLKELYAIQKSFGNSVIMDINDYNKINTLFNKLCIVREIREFKD